MKMRLDYQFHKNNLPKVSVILNALLKSSYFPVDWKKMVKIMINKPYKHNSDPNNYRLIRLPSYVWKIFEKVIHSRLISHLDVTDAIPRYLFDFRPNTSTTSSNYRAHKQWVRQIITYRSGFLDIAQAFGKVWRTDLQIKIP
jgi:hypothetical protein